MDNRSTEEMLRQRLERDERDKTVQGIIAGVVLLFMVVVVLALLYWH